MNPKTARRQGTNLTFQRDLIKTNGLLQSLVTDMRYHCEVYKLSLRSINKILKEVQQECTADKGIFAKPGLKYTARSNYRRATALVSQKRALEKINSVLKKTRTFINGYSLLEKSPVVEVAVPEFDLTRDDDESKKALPQSTQLLGDSSEAEGKQIIAVSPESNEGKARNAVKGSPSSSIEQLKRNPEENPEKYIKSSCIKVEIFKKESRVQENNLLLNEIPGSQNTDAILNLGTSVKQDEMTIDKKNTEACSCTKGQKCRKEEQCNSSGHFRCDRYIKHSVSVYNNRKSRTRSPDRPRKFRETEGGTTNENHSARDDKHSKIASIQTRRIIGSTKTHNNPPKYGRYGNGNWKSRQQIENPRKFVNNPTSREGRVNEVTDKSGKGETNDPPRKNARHSSPAFDRDDFDYRQHQYPDSRNQGKVRRVDIDPGIEINGNVKSGQVHHGNGCFSRCASSDCRFPSKGFQENKMSDSGKQDVCKTGISMESEVETPLENSSITATLIPRDSKGSAFLEDPRLKKQTKTDLTNSTGI